MLHLVGVFTAEKVDPDASVDDDQGRPLRRETSKSPVQSTLPLSLSTERRDLRRTSSRSAHSTVAFFVFVPATRWALASSSSSISMFVLMNHDTHQMQVYVYEVLIGVVLTRLRTYVRMNSQGPLVPTHRYAELHCHSNFSFLDGASHPEDLIAQAAALQLPTLALTDHDGFYGVVRFAQAAREHNIATVFGAELTLGAELTNGIADPCGDHLLVLASSARGYASLSRAISNAAMRGEKGRPVHNLEELASLQNDWAILTACRKGAVPRAITERGPLAANRELDKLQQLFGKDNVFVELFDHNDPIDSHRNDALAEIAARRDAPIVATNNVHYASQRDHPVACAVAAVRARRSLDEMDGWLPCSPTAHLRSAAEQIKRFVRYPGATDQAARLGKDCAFDLRLVAPNLPPFPVPPQHTETTWLKELTFEGAVKRYGQRIAERVKGAYAQIDHELKIIEELNFPGYFLIVWDIVEFCRRNNIYCQGRGSAANSAVCYALGITRADAVSLGLLFERFLSPGRDGPPDIDIDIESDRREEVIQYVYRRYGREHTALVANVVAYRARSAVRDAAKALGFAPGTQDAWSKQIDGWGSLTQGVADDCEIPGNVLKLASRIEGFPRHLGIHPGGMVICDRPIVEVCPVEWARMEDRSILQWDKDDCAATGLVKFDLLGLGMLSALHEAVDLIKQAYAIDVDLALIDQQDEVYEMMCRADTIGVFQIESRAQMSTLPRLKPRTFYDLVVEVALIRPGPIQGGSVHPYIRRRNGEEPVTYAHPLLEKALKKTLGVPLFQEQMMQIAMDVAGFSPADADELRQAMGSKRSHERMDKLKDRFYAGMASNGILQGEVADGIWDKLQAFANFGFPESHSVSFAYLVYASAWIKHNYPDAFLAALLNCQPMGFWAPQTLAADARRHGVVIHSVDVNLSSDKASIEPLPDSGAKFAVRLGFNSVRSIGEEVAMRLAQNQPYESVSDCINRCGLQRAQAETLATAGAFGCFGVTRRQALWSAGAEADIPGSRVAAPGLNPPALKSMSARDTAASDLFSMGLMPDGSPMQFVRESLQSRGVLSAGSLGEVANRSRIRVAGIVTHRQRPATASGMTFLNLEDETGLVNIVCHVGVWKRYGRVARNASALVITGRLECNSGAMNVIAEKLEVLDLNMSAPASRDFR